MGGPTRSEEREKPASNRSLSALFKPAYPLGWLRKWAKAAARREVLEQFVIDLKQIPAIREQPHVARALSPVASVLLMLGHLLSRRAQVPQEPRQRVG
jgi:hypothetical protein